MDHKWIMGVFIAAFCLIFVGMFLYSLLSYDMNVIPSYEEKFVAFVAQNLITFAGLMLSVSSAVGSFLVEDNYSRVGMLLFSALITGFVLMHFPPWYQYF